jgi:hypothetical protein
MDEIVGPDGRPAHFNGAAWISSDGAYWWNGATWQRYVVRRQFRINGFVVVMLLLCAGVASYLVYQYTHQPPPVAQGVFNTRIVSSTEIQFDYQRATSCRDVTFEYLFFDKKDGRVQDLFGDGHHDVAAMQVNHVDVTLVTALPSSAVRFVVVDTCHL